MLVLVTIVVIAYLYYHVTAFLEPDWRALYSAPGHGPYTHLTRPLLAFCARGDWLARLMQFDVIVVGAGVEGSATAYQLIKNGARKVLLLEQVITLS